MVWRSLGMSYAGLAILTFLGVSFWVVLSHSTFSNSKCWLSIVCSCPGSIQNTCVIVLIVCFYKWFNSRLCTGNPCRHNYYSAQSRFSFETYFLQRFLILRILTPDIRAGYRISQTGYPVIAKAGYPAKYAVRSL